MNLMDFLGVLYKTWQESGIKDDFKCFIKYILKHNICSIMSMKYQINKSKHRYKLLWWLGWPTLQIPFSVLEFFSSEFRSHRRWKPGLVCRRSPVSLWCRMKSYWGCNFFFTNITYILLKILWKIAQGTSNNQTSWEACRDHPRPSHLYGLALCRRAVFPEFRMPLQ